MAPNFGIVKSSRTSAFPMRLLALIGVEQALHRGLDLVDRLVDDVKSRIVDALLLATARLVLGLHVEAEDDGLADAAASLTSDSVMRADARGDDRRP